MTKQAKTRRRYLVSAASLAAVLGCGAPPLMLEVNAPLVNERLKHSGGLRRTVRTQSSHHRRHQPRPLCWRARPSYPTNGHLLGAITDGNNALLFDNHAPSSFEVALTRLDLAWLVNARKVVALTQGIAP